MRDRAVSGSDAPRRSTSVDRAVDEAEREGEAPVGECEPADGGGESAGEVAASMGAAAEAGSIASSVRGSAIRRASPSGGAATSVSG
jgi:hypothetical protein